MNRRRRILAAARTGQAALLVVRMQLGAQDRFDLWVNPAPATLAGADTALNTANATWTTTGATNIAFRSIGVEISGTQNRASFDEVRFGETFAAVNASLERQRVVAAHTLRQA